MTLRESIHKTVQLVTETYVSDFAHPVVFHGTTTKHLAKIQKQGLQPKHGVGSFGAYSPNEMGDDVPKWAKKGGATFVTNHPHEAEQYAHQAAANYGGHPVVLAINRHHQSAKGLHADRNYNVGRNVTAFAKGPTVFDPEMEDPDQPARVTNLHKKQGELRNFSIHPDAIAHVAHLKDPEGQATVDRWKATKSFTKKSSQV